MFIKTRKKDFCGAADDDDDHAGEFDDYNDRDDRCKCLYKSILLGGLRFILSSVLLEIYNTYLCCSNCRKVKNDFSQIVSVGINVFPIHQHRNLYDLHTLA